MEVVSWIKIDEKLTQPLTELREAGWGRDYCSQGEMQRNGAAFRKVNNLISLPAELLKGAREEEIICFGTWKLENFVLCCQLASVSNLHTAHIVELKTGSEGLILN